MFVSRAAAHQYAFCAPLQIWLHIAINKLQLPQMQATRLKERKLAVLNEICMDRSRIHVLAFRIFLNIYETS